MDWRAIEDTDVRQTTTIIDSFDSTIFFSSALDGTGDDEHRFDAFGKLTI